MVGGRRDVEKLGRYSKHALGSLLIKRIHVNIFWKDKRWARRVPEQTGEVVPGLLPSLRYSYWLLLGSSMC